MKPQPTIRYKAKGRSIGRPLPQGAGGEAGPLLKRVAEEAPGAAQVRAAQAAREHAERTGEAAARLMREVARELTRAGVSLRDAGDLMGVSFQRVAQLLE